MLFFYLFKDRLEVGRERRGEGVVLFVQRKGESVRMQEKALHTNRLEALMHFCIVRAITDDRMADGGKVYANLVHPSRARFGAEEVIAGKTLYDGVMCDSILCLSTKFFVRNL